MLSVGDLTYVPFVYTLQARYLVFSQVELGPIRTVAIFLLNFLGFYIFRVANSEKNDFRNGKNPKSEYLDVYGSMNCTNILYCRSQIHYYGKRI